MISMALRGSSLNFLSLELLRVQRLALGMFDGTCNTLSTTEDQVVSLGDMNQLEELSD